MSVLGESQGSEPRRSPVVIVGAGTSYPSIDIERGVLAAAGATIIDARALTDQEVALHAEHADAILTDYFRCDAALIKELKRCKVIASYGVGYDQIDVEAADARGIVVTNNPEYCTDEVAEHTIALLLSCWRRLQDYDRHVRAGGWDYTSSPAPQRLRGATIGVIGFGRIGRTVATLATGLGMRVLAYDPFIADTATGDGYELVDLDQLLRRADAVTLHLPLTEQSRGLLSAERLAMMKPHAGIVNSARGALVDELALADALDAGTIAWAALDAFSIEPPPSDHPLLSHPKVLLSPHAGFYSRESLLAAQENAAHEVLAVLQGKVPKHAVGKSQGAS